MHQLCVTIMRENWKWYKKYIICGEMRYLNVDSFVQKIFNYIPALITYH